jgi:transcription initiation factor TFIID subunit 8
MKRAHDAGDVPTYGQPHPKKQKVVRRIHYAQPVQHIIDPISAEIGDYGDCKGFFEQQLRRAIAIECKAIGFESATPEAVEEFAGLADSCMASHVLLRASASRHDTKANCA